MTTRSGRHTRSRLARSLLAVVCVATAALVAMPDAEAGQPKPDRVIAAGRLDVPGSGFRGTPGGDDFDVQWDPTWDYGSMRPGSAPTPRRS
jgi:hypothetical protein